VIFLITWEYKKAILILPGDGSKPITMGTFMKSINRRDFLAGLSGLAILGLAGCTAGKSPNKEKKDQNMEQADMQLRPHHILDIISDHGMGVQYEPHPYGHSQHIAAPKLLANQDLKIMLVLHADDICKGCKHLLPDGSCDDVLGQLESAPSKQAYNDDLDRRLFDYYAVEPDTVMTFRQYLEMVNAKVPGIEKVCTHPGENQEERLNGLINGLVKLGVRVSA
jgi:hypothetical protein